MVLVSSSANNSGKASVVYANSNNSSSNSNSNIGTRLSLCFPEIRKALALAKTQSNASLRAGSYKRTLGGEISSHEKI